MMIRYGLLMITLMLTTGCTGEDGRKGLGPGDLHDAALELLLNRTPAPKFDGYVEIKDGEMVPVEHEYVFE